jgi:GntR family transcriptional regulator
MKKGIQEKKITIDHLSPVPLYFQLEQALISEIEKGNLQHGEQIPTELELCNKFKISRTVVRQAINELVHYGYLTRERGKGTFVTKPKITENIFHDLVGTYEDMLAKGIKLKSKVLEQIKCRPDLKTLRVLKLKKNDFVIKIKRLRFIGEEPFNLTTSIVPYNLCPELLKEDLTCQSLYAILEDKYNLKISHGYRSLEAISASPEIASLLKVNVGDPLMLLHSVSYLKDGRPLEYYYDVQRGDRSKFQVTLIRTRNYLNGMTNKDLLSNLLGIKID